MVGLLDQYLIPGMRPPYGPFPLTPNSPQIPAGLLSGMPISPDGMGPYVLDQSGTPLQPNTGGWRQDGGVALPVEGQFEGARAGSGTSYSYPGLESPLPDSGLSPRWAEGARLVFQPPNLPVQPGGPSAGDIAGLFRSVPAAQPPQPQPSPDVPAVNAVPAALTSPPMPPVRPAGIGQQSPGPVPPAGVSAPPMPPMRPAGVNLSGPLQLPGARPPVPVGGVDMPVSPMNPDMPAIGARQAGPAMASPAAPQAAPAQGGGFFDKLGTLAGSIYGGGKNPGDNLIALGAGLASGPNWGQGLMKGMSMVNANALTAKKTEEEQKRTAGMLTMAEAMSKRNGQPVAVNLGILQSGMGAPILQDTLKRDTPQLVTVKDPITGVDRQEWVQPGQTSGTAIGGGAPQVGGAAAPAIPGQPQGTDASGQPRGLYSDPSGNRMYRTIDGRDIPVVGNIPDAVKTLTEADQKAVQEAPVAYRNLKSLKDNIDELKKHPGMTGWGGLTSMTGSLGEYVSPQTRDARQRVDQIKGQAFLQAFQQLKGAGAITEKEGDKAGQAIARMNDPRVGEQAFNQALDDLRAATEEAMQRLSKVPGVNIGQPSKAGGVSWRVVQ